MTKCIAYPHEKLNTSKVVIRSRELALDTEEEIASALGKQGVTNIRKIPIRKVEERIQTNTYILTLNHPRTPKEVKIGYFLERIEQYIPAPLRCFKCQKYGHYRTTDMFQMRWKGPDHVEKNCLKQIRYANCRQDQDHQAYARSCDVNKKVMEIIEVKHKKNVSFLEARKIIGTYIEENSYASVAQRANRTNEDNKCRTLVKELIQSEANDWPKFQEHL